ncbi:MAG: ribosomal L7Ae/L30e/S12e/Gadd45 family protein, partial [Clostridia bacterium]|nr:ribosomal L7Ae/L30e/S12e/Gadd45 family protein [Clostridia bacterium]
MDKTLSYLGLCKKAGKLVSGTDMTVEAIREGRIRLALTSSDASGNTCKRIKDACAYRNVPYASLPYDRIRISDALGNSGSTAAVGITDGGFAAM